MILDLKNLTKDPVQKKTLCNGMHTQPHAAPRVHKRSSEINLQLHCTTGKILQLQNSAR